MLWSPSIITGLNSLQFIVFLCASPLRVNIFPSKPVSIWTISAGAIGVAAGDDETGGVGVGVAENFSISSFAVPLRRSHDTKIDVDSKTNVVRIAFIQNFSVKSGKAFSRGRASTALLPTSTIGRWIIPGFSTN